jgi:hypothetical protein
LQFVEAGKLFLSETGSEAKKEESKFASFLSNKIPTSTGTLDIKCIQLIGEQRVDSIQLFLPCLQNPGEPTHA